MGKTTLALRCLELARKRGMAVARASATRASQALPFGALAPVLPPDPDGDYLGRENRTELLRRYGRAVAETAGGRPLVVFVDDAHPLDGGSAMLADQPALTGKVPPPPRQVGQTVRILELGGGGTPWPSGSRQPSPPRGHRGTAGHGARGAGGHGVAASASRALHG